MKLCIHTSLQCSQQLKSDSRTRKQWRTLSPIWQGRHTFLVMCGRNILSPVGQKVISFIFTLWGIEHAPFWVEITWLIRTQFSKAPVQQLVQAIKPHLSIWLFCIQIVWCAVFKWWHNFQFEIWNLLYFPAQTSMMWTPQTWQTQVSNKPFYFFF